MRNLSLISALLLLPSVDMFVAQMRVISRAKRLLLRISRVFRRQQKVSNQICFVQIYFKAYKFYN